MPTGSKPDVLGNDLGCVPPLPHLQPHKDFACLLNVDIIQEYKIVPTKSTDTVKNSRSVTQIRPYDIH